ncbi:MAG: hypothetical protein ACYTBP_05670 [Planctomycetota bacterium]|jgi:hypothetical protein
MRKTETGLKTAVYLVIILICGLLIPSCKKSTEQAQSTKENTEKSATQETTETTTQTSSKPKMVPLDIKLPRPMFVGTPTNISGVANLMKPLGKPRPLMLVPEGTTNVASGKSVTSSYEEPIIGDFSLVTDGDKEAIEGSYVELGFGKQSITIDLGAEYNIYAIVVWHNHKQQTVYFDVAVQVAEDPDFVTAVMVFNNDIDNSLALGKGNDMHYVETNEGKLIDAKGQKARYVRLWSNGNNAEDFNHYTEVEVYGKPAE